MNIEFDFSPIEIPFDLRHCCWFCGEPNRKWLNFPHHNNVVIDLAHPKLSLPACDECYQDGDKSNAKNIWQCRAQVKAKLAKRYKKHLAIGIQWTKEELENSGFEGGNFEGFARSGWLMFEIARDRLNFVSWPLIINGIACDETAHCDAMAEEFSFDGVTYPNLNEAIIHFTQAYLLDREFFIKVLSIYGREDFATAVRFCRLQVGKTPNERNQALNSLKALAIKQDN